MSAGFGKKLILNSGTVLYDGTKRQENTRWEYEETKEYSARVWRREKDTLLGYEEDEGTVWEYEEDEVTLREYEEDEIILWGYEEDEILSKGMKKMKEYSLMVWSRQRNILEGYDDADKEEMEAQRSEIMLFYGWKTESRPGTN